jgi:C1A family cysteine protease
MPTTDISDVPELKPYYGALKALGYTTTDQLAGAVQAASGVLSEYLKIDPEMLYSLVHNIPRRQRTAYTDAAPRFRALGVALERVPRSRRAFMMSASTATPLPPLVNLIAQMRPIRDQGTRGTCVAHASTAAAEHYWGSAGQVVDLSRQFLYWDCKQHDGHPQEEGTWIGVAMPQLQADGCCLEATWPYVPDPIAGNESQDPPPAAAVPQAVPYRIPAFHQLSPTSLQDIKGELAAGRCVAFSIPVFNSWYQNDEVTRTGEIVNPIPNENDSGGHAMCFVGYEDMPDEAALGGGRFYLRNSWNGYWATQSVLGTTGYGTIPYSYIARFGMEAYSIG